MNYHKRIIILKTPSYCLPGNGVRRRR